MTGKIYSGASQVTVLCSQLGLTFCENTHIRFVFSSVCGRTATGEFLFGGQNNKKGIFHPSVVSDRRSPP